MKEKLLLTDFYHKPTGLNINAPISEISEIVCAVNESPSFSIIINNEGQSIRYVGDSSPSMGLYPIPQYRISIDSPFENSLHPVGYICDNNEVKVADIIHGSTSLDYAGDELPYIICDLALPNGVQTGQYQTTVKLYVSYGLNDESLIATKHINIVIKDVKLPVPSQYTLYNDIWQHNSNIARTFGVELWSARHFELIDKVLDKLVKLGQKSATIIVSDCPWRGWGCYVMRDKPANMFEYSCVKTYLKDGKFSYDYTALDRLIDLYTLNGIDGDITLYGLIGIWRMPFFNTSQTNYPEQVKIRYTDVSDSSTKYMQNREEIIEYISALFTHLHELDVWDKVRIGADEPSVIEPFKENLEILKSICPDVKLKLAIDKPNVIESLGNLTEDVAYSFPCTLDNYNKSISASRKLYYVCNIPHRPNSQLHNSIMDNVAVILLNHQFGLDGFLRWAFTCWTQKPLEDVRYNVSSLPAGDMYLIYPAKDGNLLESIRYRAYHHGIILYELLVQIKAQNIDKFNSLIMKIIGKNDDFYMINEEIGISETADNYRALYSEILDYLSEVK